MYDHKIYLGENLRRLRMVCGYTQEDVADILGLSRPAYSCYELGKTTPNVETLSMLAEIFGVTLDQLVLPEEAPHIDPGRLRVKHRPTWDPQTIGQLTEEEKLIIARHRAGGPPKKS